MFRIFSYGAGDAYAEKSAETMTFVDACEKAATCSCNPGPVLATFVNFIRQEPIMTSRRTGASGGCTAAGLAAAVLALSWLSVANVRTQDTIVDPKRLEFTQDGGAIGFVLYAKPVQGRTIRVDLGPLLQDPKGNVTAAFPRLSPGTYAVTLAAYNHFGESEQSNVAPFRVVITERASRDPSPTAIGKRGGVTATTPGTGDGLGKRLWRLLIGDDSDP